MSRTSADRSRVRTALFWVHLTSGVVAGAVILVMSVTGVALTYEKQLLSWADRSSLSSPITPVGTPLPLDSLVRVAEAAEPGRRPSAVTVSADPASAVKIAFGREATQYVDPYSGYALGAGSTGTKAVLASITAWHRWLGATDSGRETGKAITGAANLAFLLLVLTGAVLWFPRRLTWTQFRNVLLFRRGLGGKARDFNWHNVLGVWSVVPLVLIVASGVVISYGWAGDLVYRLSGETPPPRATPAPPPPTASPSGNQTAAALSGRTSTGAAPDAAPATIAPADVALEPFVAAAAARVLDWRTITVPLPVDPSKGVAVSIDRGTGGQPQLRATLTLDPATAAEREWLPFAAQGRGRRARSFLRFAHTGEYFGLLGQTIAGLVTLATVVLVWTGIALAWRRMRDALRRSGGAGRSDSGGGGEGSRAALRHDRRPGLQPHDPQPGVHVVHEGEVVLHDDPPRHGGVGDLALG